MAQISVIVPVYKVEPYLNRCVDSILSQTFIDFELILIDDGSPDNSGVICDQYAAQDKRIHVIHQKNGGLSAARNAGIDWVFINSDSQWITFIDSDDWIHPEMLDCLLKMNLIYGTNLSVCKYVQTFGEEPSVDEKFTSSLWIPEELFCKYNVEATIACAKLYRRDCFEQLRYPIGLTHEDEYITYRILFSQDAVAVTQRPMYYYFYNSESISKSDWSIKRLDAIPALKGQVEYFQKNNYHSAYGLAATNYAARLLSNRKHLLVSEVPEHTKRVLARSLRRELHLALWNHRKFYLKEERGVYVESFPRMALLIRFVKNLLGKNARKEV